MAHHTVSPVLLKLRALLPSGHLSQVVAITLCAVVLVPIALLMIVIQTTTDRTR